MKIAYKNHREVPALLAQARGNMAEGKSVQKSILEAAKYFNAELGAGVIRFLTNELQPKAAKKVKAPKAEKIKGLGKAKIVEVEAEMAEEIAPSVNQMFDINKRFQIFENMTRMVGGGATPSLIITGTGGLGKSYTCMRVLSEMGLLHDDEEKSKVKIMKGYSTARGLYNFLHDNKNAVIVFDDCDSVLKDATATNILKAALDSYGKRTVSWNSVAIRDDGRPSSFDFTGSVIFISNMSRTKVPQALLSRSLNVDLGMTTNEMISRMKFILPQIETHIDLTTRVRAMSFIEKNHKHAKNMSLRTLVQVIKIASVLGDDFEETALYTMASC